MVNMNTRAAIVEHEQTIREIYNAAHNFDRILILNKGGRAEDFSLLPPKLNRNVILTSSGPSLDSVLPFLQGWDGDIICHFRQAVTLASLGIIPSFIIGLDPRFAWPHISEYPWETTDTVLITHPGVHESVFMNWPNKISLFRQAIGDDKSYHRYNQNVMYSTMTIPIDDYINGMFAAIPMIPTELPVFANTPSLEYVVAYMLQYRKIFLAGFDFQTDNNKRRFTERVRSDEKWIDTPDYDPEEVTAADTLEHQKAMFLCAVRMFPHQCAIFNPRAITELPSVKAAQMIKHNGRKAIYFCREKTIKKIDVSLAKQNIAVIEHVNGTMNFLNFKDFAWCRNKLFETAHTVRCNLCGFTATHIDGEGKKCRKCEVGIMENVNNIDIRANIARFKEIEKRLKSETLAFSDKDA